jgi:hypothetical protein
MDFDTKPSTKIKEIKDNILAELAARAMQVFPGPHGVGYPKG